MLERYAELRSYVFLKKTQIQKERVESLWHRFRQIRVNPLNPRKSAIKGFAAE